MSQTHYTVNDDIYGKILKSHNNSSSTKTEYAEVYEAVDGLGIFLFTFIILLKHIFQRFFVEFNLICKPVLQYKNTI